MKEPSDVIVDVRLLDALDNKPGINGWHRWSAILVADVMGVEAAINWVKLLPDLTEIMQCGHPRSALRWDVAVSGLSTHWCSECQMEADNVRDNRPQ